MAWRPAYQPQFPHTTCGSFADEQRGQTLRAGTSIVHAEARWLRLLDFDFFFFGTGMAIPRRNNVDCQGAQAPGTKEAA
jgi:hypothetical protein